MTINPRNVVIIVGGISAFLTLDYLVIKQEKHKQDMIRVRTLVEVEKEKTKQEMVRTNGLEELERLRQSNLSHRS